MTRERWTLNKQVVHQNWCFSTLGLRQKYKISNTHLIFLRLCRVWHMTEYWNLSLRKIVIWILKNCEKLQKKTKIVIFSQKLPLAFFFEKMTIFDIKKICQVFSNFILHSHGNFIFYIQMAIFRRVRCILMWLSKKLYFSTKTIFAKNDFLLINLMLLFCLLN